MPSFLTSSGLMVVLVTLVLSQDVANAQAILTRLASVTGKLGSAIAALPRNQKSNTTTTTPSVVANTTSSCPISAATFPLDLSPVAKACVPGENYCGSCICALFGAYTPALVAANLLQPGMPISSVPVDAATQVIRDCTVEYYVPLLVAQANFTSLEQLGSCDFSGANVPACLISNYVVSASSGMDAGNSSMLPNSTSTMYKADSGMYANMTLSMTNFTLTNISVANGDIMAVAAGQVSSLGDILAAILSNGDITSDLGSDAMIYLQQLAASPVAAAGLPDSVSTTLASPSVDVSILLSQIADFAAAAGNMTVAVSSNSTMSSNMTMPVDVATTPKAVAVNMTASPAMKAPAVSSASGPSPDVAVVVAPTATATPAPATVPTPVKAPLPPTGSALPTPTASVLTLAMAAVGGLLLSSML